MSYYQKKQLHGDLPQQKQDPSLDSAFFCSEKYRSNSNVALNWPRVLEGKEMTDLFHFHICGQKEKRFSRGSLLRVRSLKLAARPSKNVFPSFSETTFLFGLGLFQRAMGIISFREVEEFSNHKKMTCTTST